MGRRSISATLIASLACVALSQGFGRFGYSESIAIPGFSVGRDGFKVNHPAADTFRFDSSAKLWKPVATSELSQTVFLGTAPRAPSKLRVELLGSGFSVYCETGFSFTLSALSGPFLSWPDGSVGPDVPTPKAKWVLISFRDAQPPVLLGFLGPPCAVEVSGKSGRWRIRSEGAYRGWIRVVAPLGIVPFAAHGASQLGAAVQRIKASATYFSDPVPRPISFETIEDAQGVEAKWTFDRVGAVVPVAALLAPLGGYPLRILSQVKRLEGYNESGPVSVCEGNDLTVRLPVRRIPTGRSVSVGAIGSEPPGSISTLDISGIVELALFNLSSQRDKIARELAEDTFAEFLGEAAYEVEPFTGQRLPFGPSGKGMDIAAAHALLLQSVTTSERATSEPNSLLTSITWRRDWLTWRVWCSDPALSRRTTALAAIAGAICPEPSRRADAGMFQAGLAAERGLAAWRRRLGQNPGPGSFLEPLLALRQGFFALESPLASDKGFVRSLQSEIRVYGELAVSAAIRDGQLVLSWGTRELVPKILILASAYPIVVTEGANLTINDASEALGFTVIRFTPKETGKCEIVVKAPEWAAPLPATADPPRYEEPIL